MRVARDRVIDSHTLGSNLPRSSVTHAIGSGRIVGSALAIGAGVVHLVLAGPHFEEATWLGTAFLLDGFVFCAAGVWLLFGSTKQPKRAAVVIAALTVVAYLASRTMGLPGMEREGWDSLGLVTTIAELMIVASLPILDRSRPEAALRGGLISRGRRDA